MWPAERHSPAYDFQVILASQAWPIEQVVAHRVDLTAVGRISHTRAMPSSEQFGNPVLAGQLPMALFKKLLTNCGCFTLTNCRDAIEITRLPKHLGVKDRISVTSKRGWKGHPLFRQLHDCVFRPCRRNGRKGHMLTPQGVPGAPK